jgi:acetyl-CoA carboxylase biotin carboxyl carrier protein
VSAAIVALATRDGARWIVKAPQPGWFRPTIAHGAAIAPGRELGVLIVLGKRLRVVAPDVRGLATVATAEPRAVGYGDVIAEVAHEATAAPPASRESTTLRDLPKVEPRGLLFRAPTSGRYYARPSPDKPPFVVVGGELARGATVCLLEVMKTFNRVTYGGAGLPERARVKDVLAADGADVSAGEPLLALEPL